MKARFSITVVAVLLVVGSLFLGGCLGPTVPVVNQKPVAVFSTAPGVAVNIFTFDGSPSYDLDGTIVDWSWTFGDGESADGVAVEHTYTHLGIYSVQLTVIDNDGAVDTVMRNVPVNTLPSTPAGMPVAVFTWEVQTGSTTVVFDGTGSYYVTFPGYADGYIAWATWEFGDGTGVSGYWTWFDGTPMAMYASHTYLEAGEYVVKLIVKDNEGYRDLVLHTVVVP